MGEPRTAPRPQQGMTADNDRVGTPIRHTAGTDSTRPEYGALARCKCGLLAPTGTAVNPSDTGDQGRGDGHEATGGTADQARRETETETGDETQQRALPVRGM